MLACVLNGQTIGRCLGPLGGACDTSQWSNITLQEDFQCISPPLSWWTNACLCPTHGGAPTMYFPPPLFSLSLTLKHMQPLQKIRKGVWFVKLITFGCLFACIKFYLFYFQFDSLWFDFSIEFVILFYVF